MRRGGPARAVGVLVVLALAVLVPPLPAAGAAGDRAVPEWSRMTPGPGDAAVLAVVQAINAERVARGRAVLNYDPRMSSGSGDGTASGTAGSYAHPHAPSKQASRRQ